MLISVIAVGAVNAAKVEFLLVQWDLHLTRE
jgi:hypothetical protein